MANELGSGFFGLDLGSITQGSDQAVLPDVSYGGADEQPSTPAGNGLGHWLQGQLDKAVNFAMAKDASSWNQMPRYGDRDYYPTATTARPYQQGITVSNQLLLMVGAGVLLFMVAKKA